MATFNESQFNKDGEFWIRMVAYGDSATARIVAGGIFGILAKVI